MIYIVIYCLELMMERKQYEDSIDMAKEAVREGITYNHCHSHHKNNQYENEKTSILEKVSHLNQHSYE